MKYNFDEWIERRGTYSIKYDFARYGKPAGTIPLWVADMDFRIPPEVTAALQKSVEHGIYGYTETSDDYFQAVYHWFAKVHDYHVQEDWLVKTPGIVYALGMAVKAFTSPGDAILIQKPLYYPIENTIVANGRVTVDNTLMYAEGKYTIDMADFEQKIVEHQCRMFILCNPHNPVGRVWTRDELTEMGHICKTHNVLVVSDEIHCDIVFEGHRHWVFSAVYPDVDTVICTAPSKTFNLAGLQCSNIFIADEKLRRKFKHEIHASGYSQLNTLGLVAGQAAYAYGREWHRKLVQYLGQNTSYVTNFLAKNIPQVRVITLEGSYLMWLDFNAFRLSHNALDDMISNKAKLWLSSGTIFGKTGSGFFRMNLACPRRTLEMAMERLCEVFGSER